MKRKGREGHSGEEKVLQVERYIEEANTTPLSKLAFATREEINYKNFCRWFKVLELYCTLTNACRSISTFTKKRAYEEGKFSRDNASFSIILLAMYYTIHRIDDITI